MAAKMKFRSRPLLFLASCFLTAAAAGTVAAPLPSASLADAAMNNDLSALSALLQNGADVGAALGDGMTALHWAAYNGNADMARQLIGAGASVAAKTRLGEHTPLHIASKAGSDEVSRLLIEGGSDVNAKTTTGAAPLHFAAASGSAGTVVLLLEHGATVDAKEPIWGQTPLMFAAAAGRVAAVEALLEHGADVGVSAKVVDVASRSELDRAERREHRRRIERMRDTEQVQSSESPAQGPESPESPESMETERPAEQASETDAATIERRLKEREEAEQRGGEPVPLGYAELVGTHGGLTPLLLAVRQGHIETAVALVHGGADINQPSQGDHTTPMLMAMINGHFDLGMRLFELGADPALASDAGATPLYAALNMHWAPKSRHPQPAAYMQQRHTYMDVMETLLKAGVDPNVRLEKTLWYTTYNRDLLGVDRTGATAFWRAAYSLDIPAMRLLLKYGADPNIPTIRVPERRDPDLGEQEEGGADLSGIPPVPLGGPAVYAIHAASGVGHGQGFAGNSHRHVPDGWLPAVKFLVEELGADVNARDHKGYTPVHHAAARGDNTLIQYLVSKGADATAVARNGQTTADMANGPVERVQPYPETVALLMSLGAKNNDKCVSC